MLLYAWLVVVVSMTVFIADVAQGAYFVLAAVLRMLVVAVVSMVCMSVVMAMAVAVGVFVMVVAASGGVSMGERFAFVNLMMTVAVGRHESLEAGIENDPRKECECTDVVFTSRGRGR